MNGDKQTDKNAFTAETLDPLDVVSTYMAKVIFAENAPGGPEAWMNIGNAFMNRYKTGKFGKTLGEVLKKGSSAVRNDDPQWQKADKLEFDDYESRVFGKIKDVAEGIVGGKVPDTVKGATHFENLGTYPMPYWAKDMDAVAIDRGQDKRWNQTYFKAKSQVQPQNGSMRHGPYSSKYGQMKGEREVR